MRQINDCLQELLENLTPTNYKILVSMILEQHKKYNWQTPQNQIIALLSGITQEEGLNLGEFCREYEYEDVVEILQTAME